MKKFKKNKGVTLVALVVTIVVLLILAGITITALFSENGIIKKAQEAKNATEQDEIDTDKGLKNLEETMGAITGEYAWKVSDDRTKVINKNYPDGIEIGDYIDYKCADVAEGVSKNYVSSKEINGCANQTFNLDDYKYGWRVLGADNKGQLLLISEEIVPITIADGSDNTWNTNIGYECTDRNSFLINGKEEYENGIKELENISKFYGQGKGATGGTVLTVEDVNEFTGLNGNNIDGTGTKYEKGNYDEYQNKVTYYWDGTDKPYYETSNGLKENLDDVHNVFCWFDDNGVFHKSTKPTTLTTQTTNVSEMEKITTLTSTYYEYTASIGMETTSKIYKMLFTNSSTGAYSSSAGNIEGVMYYLASLGIDTNKQHAHFGLSCVYEGEVNRGGSIYYSCENNTMDFLGVRPVVTLKQNISLTENGTRDNCKLYHLEEK